jgi:hypothetical protein
MVDFMVDESMNQIYDYAVSIAHEIGLTNKILGKVIPFTMTERKQVYCQKLAEQLFQINNFREPTEIERNTRTTSMMVNWYDRWKKWAESRGK